MCNGPVEDASGGLPVAPAGVVVGDMPVDELLPGESVTWAGLPNGKVVAVWNERMEDLGYTEPCEWKGMVK